MAGSPTKHNRGGDEFEENEENEEKSLDLPQGREEMNGIIVYDSYAKLVGCEKIVKYFQDHTY